MAGKRKKKVFAARRKFNLRRDASVATGQKKIERVFGLPEESVRLHLPSGRRARTDKTIGRDAKTKDFVVVDFNRGEAPTETLIRVLHYMSWVRQTLAGSKDVRGIILTESANEALSEIIKEVPNVDLRFYRIGIELLSDPVSASA
jgi:hypothetical protein